MMEFIGDVTCILFAFTGWVIFACVWVVGLSVLDYLLDSNIKGALVRWLGPRTFLRGLRLRLLKLTKKFDTPSHEDLDISPDGIWRGGEDYDAEIHRLIEEISDESDSQE